MAFNIFGYTFKKSEKEQAKEEAKSFTPPTNDDGSSTVSGYGTFGAYLDLDASIKNEYELITKYRELSLLPEVDSAIDDIVNEAIVIDGQNQSVTIGFAKKPFNKEKEIPKQIKDKIREEFDNILSLLDWNNNAYEIFKKWYIDGRLYYHKVVEEKKESEGILELRYIDPRQIRKVREVEEELDQKTGIKTIKIVKEYYTFAQRGIQQAAALSYVGTPHTTLGTQITEDCVAYSNSGVVDRFSSTILSHLHKAIKPINQLKMMEDALVIYRISRAPERRIFYVDVGNLPKSKADDYLRSVMQRYRNKLVYNAETGEIKDDRRFLSIMEDYWIPRREGGQATSIDTLPGGENLGELEDVEYFQEKVYQALNVPRSRLSSESGFNLGRSTEITRDELKFTKFIHRLRARFSNLFDNLLKTQLILKNIINPDEWENIKESLFYDFANDNYFSELKESEILENRLKLLAMIDPYVNKYISVQWVREKLLKQSEDDQAAIDKQIKAEKDKFPAPTDAPSSLNITNFEKDDKDE